MYRHFLYKEQHIAHHTRNQHLRNHRGVSVACFNGLSVAVPNGISLSSVTFKRIVTCPVDFYWNCQLDCQGYFPMPVFVRSGEQYFALKGRPKRGGEDVTPLSLLPAAARCDMVLHRALRARHVRKTGIGGET